MKLRELIWKCAYDRPTYEAFRDYCRKYPDFSEHEMGAGEAQKLVGELPKLISERSERPETVYERKVFVKEAKSYTKGRAAKVEWEKAEAEKL